MLDYDTRVRRRILLLAMLSLIVAAAIGLHRHQRGKVKPSKEMKQGVKVLTDPESVVDELGK